MQKGQCVYIVRKSDNIVLEQYNSRPFDDKTEYLGYSFKCVNVRHESGAFLYTYDMDLVNRDYTQDEEYRQWIFKKESLSDLSKDFISAYGSYGSLGALIADAKARFSDAEKDNIDVFLDEFRHSDNIVDYQNCSNNVGYSDADITEQEKGCYYVDNIAYDATIITKPISKSFSKYYACLVSTVLECGYKLQDIELKYRKGNGNWLTASPLGKFPYSVFAKIEDEREGDIALKLILKTGNAVKKPALISFAIVGY